METTRLKGGSLSGTYLVSEGGRRFIRKDVSHQQDREYGFYRWMSQLKKLQRLKVRHPELFPAVLDIDADEQKSWFDLEYVDGAVTLSEYLGGPVTDADADRALAAFLDALDRLHRVRIPSFPHAIRLYLSQEVDRALHFCLEDPDFRAFTRHERLVFNGVEVPALLTRVDRIRALAERHYVDPWETDTHGNVTLENTLYVPSEGRIVFIDTYEENFVDNVWNEYSQVLQSCSSLYELYNAADAAVDGPRIELRITPPPGLARFDAGFQAELGRRLTPDELVITKLYEVTQFTRMLPFKLHVARDKMIFFYGLASALLDRLCREHD